MAPHHHIMSPNKLPCHMVHHHRLRFHVSHHLLVFDLFLPSFLCFLPYHLLSKFSINLFFICLFHLSSLLPWIIFSHLFSLCLSLVFLSHIECLRPSSHSLSWIIITHFALSYHFEEHLYLTLMTWYLSLLIFERFNLDEFCMVLILALMTWC